MRKVFIFGTMLVALSTILMAAELQDVTEETEELTETETSFPIFYFPDNDINFSVSPGENIHLFNGDLNFTKTLCTIKGPGDLLFNLVERYSAKNAIGIGLQFMYDNSFPLLGCCYGLGWDYTPATIVHYNPNDPLKPGLHAYLRIHNKGWIDYYVGDIPVDSEKTFPIDTKTKTQLTCYTGGDYNTYTLRFKDGTTYLLMNPSGYCQPGSNGVNTVQTITTPQGQVLNFTYYDFGYGNIGIDEIYYQNGNIRNGVHFQYNSSNLLTNINQYHVDANNNYSEKVIQNYNVVYPCELPVRFSQCDAIGNTTNYRYQSVTPFQEVEIIEGVTSPTGSLTHYDFIERDVNVYNIARRYQKKYDYDPDVYNDNLFEYPGNNLTIVFSRRSGTEDTTLYCFDQYGELDAKINLDASEGTNYYEGTVYYHDAYHNITSVQRQYNMGATIWGQWDPGDLFSTINYTYDTTIATNADQWGLVTKIDGAMGECKEFTYDPSNLFHKVKSIKSWLDATNYSMQYFDINNTNGNIDKILFKFGVGDQSVPTNDGDDIETQINYFSNWNIKNVIDPNGGRRGFAYDAEGIYPQSDSTLVSNTPPTMLVNSYVYDQLTGLPQSSTDPNGRTYTYTYDANNRILTKTNPDRSVKSFSYHDPDPLGDKMYRVTVTDEDGRLVKTLYDELGRLKQSKILDFDNERCLVVDYIYDNNSRLWKKSDTWLDNSFSGTHTFDLILIVPADVKYTEYTYDNLGRITRITRQDGTHYDYTYSYGTKTGLDGTFYIIKTTNANGYVSKQYRDKSGRMKAVEDAYGILTVINEYDRNNRRTSIKNAKNETTSFTYDIAGNKTAIYYPDGNHTEFQYDKNGNLRYKFKPNKFVNNADYIEYRYDLANRLIEYGTINAVGTYTMKVGYKYTGIYVDSIIDPIGWSTYQYNTRGFVINEWKKMTALNKIYNIKYEYDKTGKNVAVIYPNGYRAHYNYDAFNRLGSLIDGNPAGIYNQYYYNNRGQLWQKNVSNGASEYFGYDLRGNINSHDISSTAEFFLRYYSYDNVGNLVSDYGDTYTYDEYGDAEYEYDGNNQLITEHYYGDIITHDQSYTYNDAGERIATTKNGLSSSYVYDLAGKLTQVTGNSPLTFGYDANGNTISLTDPIGTATLGYDYGDRLVSWAKGNTKFNYSYDAFGHRVFRQKTVTSTSTRPKNVYLSNEPGAVDVTTESEGGNAPRIKIDKVTTTQTITQNYYLWDIKGNLICDLDASGNYLKTYFYDGRGKLSHCKTVNQNMVVDWGFKQLADAPWFSWAPDGMTGECTWEPDISVSHSGKVSLVSWGFSAMPYQNFVQNIGAMTLPFNASCYVATNNLTGGVRLVVEFWDNTYTTCYGQTQTATITGTNDWTLLNLPVSTVPLGTTAYKIVLQRFIGDGMARFDDVRCEKGSIRVDDSLFYYHPDRLGTIRMITDQSGNVTWHQSTTAFGEDLSTMTGNNYKFTGKQQEENGLYDYSARYYMPSIGRFISADPIRKHREYIYCINNPLKYVDPTGLYEDEPDYDYDRYEEWRENIPDQEWSSDGAHEYPVLDIYLKPGECIGNIDDFWDRFWDDFWDRLTDPDMAEAIREGVGDIGDADRRHENSMSAETNLYPYDAAAEIMSARDDITETLQMIIDLINYNDPVNEPNTDEDMHQKDNYPNYPDFYDEDPYSPYRNIP